MYYKYYANNCYNLDALSNQYLWFSKRKFLNDPYDLNVNILNRFTKLKSELQKCGDIASYPNIVEQFGICCFTTDCLNKHMWALYANSYKGWCLEFEDDIVDPCCGVPCKYIPVQYQEQWPDLNNFDTEIRINVDNDGNIVTTPIRELLRGGEREIEKLFQYLLSAKEKAIWEQEKEYRLFLGKIYHNMHSIDTAAPGYRVPWKDGALKRIIMGHNIEPYFKESLVQIAQERAIPLLETQPVLTDETYKLDIHHVSVHNH